MLKTVQKEGGNGSILTFEDIKMDPKWSFAKIDDEGVVLRVKEKEAISRFATVGLYYFSKGKYYVDYALDMIIENDRTNNEFYNLPGLQLCYKGWQENIDSQYR